MLGEVVDGAEVRLGGRDHGEPVWLGITARPLRFGSEVSQGGVVVFRDITERKNREHALVNRLA